MSDASVFTFLLLLVYLPCTFSRLNAGVFTDYSDEHPDSPSI